VQITEDPDIIAKFRRIIRPFKTITLLSGVTSPVCRELFISLRRNVHSCCLWDG